MTSFYTEVEIEKMGFQSLGSNVLISRKASIYGIDKISIGNNVRIDDFCILSGNITLGNYIHISASTLLFGGECGIKLCDYVTVSSRTAIYAESDDYSGNAMTNPMIPEEFRNVFRKMVELNRHVIIGTGCTILPGVHIGEGVSVGCMSLVNESLDDWGMYVGIPCKRIKERSRKLLELEEKFYLYQSSGEIDLSEGEG